MAKSRVSTITESDTGRNLTFKDNKTGSIMTRASFVSKIQKGEYPHDHFPYRAA